MGKLVRATADGLGIVFEPPATEKLTKPEAEFMIALDRLTFRISSSFREQLHRSELIDKIVIVINQRIDSLSASQNYAQLLQTIQIPILSGAIKVRQAYISDMIKYSKYPLFVGLLLCLAWIILTSFITKLYAFAGALGPSLIGQVVNIVGVVGFTLIGLVFGVGLSVYVTNNKLTLENFDKIQRYELPVTTYFIYLYILTAVVLVLLYFNVLVLGVGSTTLNQVSSQPPLGLLVGLLCGGSELLIAERIIQVIRPSTPRISESPH